MTVVTGWDPAYGPMSVLGALDVSLAMVTPAGATFPVGGVAPPAFSTGVNPVHSWTNDGGAYVVTFLKASLWNLTRSRCLVAGCEAMVGSRSCSRDMLELGNDDLLWPLLREIRSHILVGSSFTLLCLRGWASPSWWFTLRLAALYINLLSTYQ
jgi:hypothetical protein